MAVVRLFPDAESRAPDCLRYRTTQLATPQADLGSGTDAESAGVERRNSDGDRWLGQVCRNGLHVRSAACCCDRPRVGRSQRRRVRRIDPQPSAHWENHEARMLNPDGYVVHERHPSSVAVDHDGEQSYETVL